MQTNPGSSTLLKAVLGSTAFGLSNADSDMDYGAIFAAPTIAFHGLGAVQESYTYKNPDTWYHEVGKYCRLALKANPTILDLLWVEHYNVRTLLGTELISLRKNFLSASYVRNAYFGYATQQMEKLINRSGEEKTRPAKHARHMLRLLHQGYQLYSTGDYSVKVSDPEFFIDFGKKVGDNGDIAYAKELLVLYRDLFNTSTTPLPEKPNPEPIEEWLLKVRNEFYIYPDTYFDYTVEEPVKWFK